VDAALQYPADGELSFFVTSTGSGESGGNLGGLAGADETCAALAEGAGAVGFTWRAYLSTATVNAIDRIGNGPWYNGEGDLVAADLASLRTSGISNAAPQHMRDENGDVVPQNEHDILTGSNEAGELYVDEAGAAHTCNDWTSSAADPGGPRVGHSDQPTNPMFSRSWNSAHDAPACVIRRRSSASVARVDCTASPSPTGSAPSAGPLGGRLTDAPRLHQSALPRRVNILTVPGNFPSWTTSYPQPWGFIPHSPQHSSTDPSGYPQAPRGKTRHRICKPGSGTQLRVPPERGGRPQPEAIGVRRCRRPVEPSRAAVEGRDLP